MFSAVFPKTTVSACTACMLSLLQKPVFDQHHLNRVVPLPGGHFSLSFPLPHPPLPQSPQKATPQRVLWRRKKQLPSVGSRWNPSPFTSLFIFSFFPSSCSPGFHTFISIPIRFAAILSLPNFFVHMCLEAHTTWCTLSSHAFHLSPSVTRAAELLSDTGSM